MKTRLYHLCISRLLAKICKNIYSLWRNIHLLLINTEFQIIYIEIIFVLLLQKLSSETKKLMIAVKRLSSESDLIIHEFFQDIRKAPIVSDWVQCPAVSVRTHVLKLISQFLGENTVELTLPSTLVKVAKAKRIMKNLIFYLKNQFFKFQFLHWDRISKTDAAIWRG